MHPALDDVTFRPAQMQVVLIDEGFGNLNQRDRARQPSIIPPIGFERRNAVCKARIVHRGHHKVSAGVNRGRYLAVEAGKAALVLADLLPVDPEPRSIVGRAHVQKDAGVLFGLVSEVALVPDGPFVEEERFALGVPVAGHLQLGRLGKVVLGHKLVARLCFAVEKPAVFFLLVMKVIEAGEIRIDDGCPVAVQREGWPAVRAGEDDGRGPGSGEGRKRGSNHGKNHPAGDSCVGLCKKADSNVVHSRASAIRNGIGAMATFQRAWAAAPGGPPILSLCSVGYTLPLVALDIC